MFSGIIQGKFDIVNIQEKTDFKTFTIALSDEIATGIIRGASVALAGVCLTATEIDGNTISFDIMLETLRKTTLGEYEAGDNINVERSMKFGDEVGGHIVSGHVTGTAEIIAIESQENNTTMTFQADPAWMKYILNKGFIALDGASLTIVDPNAEKATFDVWFIPETLEKTTFGDKKIGDKVNLEIESQTQAIVDTVERVLASRKE